MTFLSKFLNLFRKENGGSGNRASSSPASAPADPSLYRDSAVAAAPAEYVIAGPLTISAKALALIIEFEVGSRDYYHRKLAKPTWPGGQSGVTIGCGYDLGYNKPAQILADWQDLLPTHREALARLAGIKGDAARRMAPTVSHITVPWVVAEKVFMKRTLPRFGLMAANAFPGLAGLHSHIQGALLSIVFNRGASMSGDSRLEMRAIKEAIQRGDLAAIPGHIRSMKRLWKNKGLDGLLRRRDAEAKLVESAL
jgi:hypothetical protein